MDHCRSWLGEAYPDGSRELWREIWIYGFQVCFCHSENSISLKRHMQLGNWSSRRPELLNYLPKSSHDFHFQLISWYAGDLNVCISSFGFGNRYDEYSFELLWKNCYILHNWKRLYCILIRLVSMSCLLYWNLGVFYQLLYVVSWQFSRKFKPNPILSNEKCYYVIILLRFREYLVWVHVLQSIFRCDMCSPFTMKLIIWIFHWATKELRSEHLTW